MNTDIFEFGGRNADFENGTQIYEVGKRNAEVGRENVEFGNQTRIVFMFDAFMVRRALG